MAAHPPLRPRRHPPRPCHLRPRHARQRRRDHLRIERHGENRQREQPDLLRHLLLRLLLRRHSPGRLRAAARHLLRRARRPHAPGHRQLRRAHPRDARGS
ncbi:hypothetical protein FRC98_13385 [Lujinxingia vulgaris]|uniref:Uncharacterized protein n=1 Tax=Lujinxingia vulgaris TaxID=2600176 RepID=A0A5C6X3E7_9DELT|nr:hypothetical protein FRC98_13385 [Lujinxingia vulgaris]